MRTRRYLALAAIAALLAWSAPGLAADEIDDFFQEPGTDADTTAGQGEGSSTDQSGQAEQGGSVLKQLQAEQEKERAKYAAQRRSQIGTGDRSERIRTYNFPQSRCTDHRIGFTLHSLPQILEGNLEPLIAELQRVDFEERFAALTGQPVAARRRDEEED